jgi:hypothetical protein
VKSAEEIMEILEAFDLIRKSTVSKQAAAPGAAQRSRVQAVGCALVRRRLEGDLVAEGFELSDVVALAALGVALGRHRG